MEQNVNQDKRLIYTDTEITKYTLWSAYNGYRHHYNLYMAAVRYNHNPQTFRKGLDRYAIDLLDEINPMLEEFVGKKKSIKTNGQGKKVLDNSHNYYSEEELGKIRLVKAKLDDPFQRLVVADYVFIREFVSKFFFASGIKDVVMDSDKRHWSEM